MAILVQQKNKKQNVLMIVFVAVILAIGFIVWRGNSGEPIPVLEETPAAIPPAEIKIDFDVLNNPLLKDLQPFSKIQPFQPATSGGQQMGRANPFSPQ